jgi:hypothetical protein
MDRSFNGAGVIAASFVLVAMVALYWNISGPLAPDWLAYERLYQAGGGYLARQGRDPSFVVIVQWASRLFGPQAGYWTFRDALFGVFALTGVYLALRIPEQDYFGRMSFLIVAPLVVMPFLLKGLIQIREGLAFVFVAAALPSMFGRGAPRFLLLGAGLAVAASIHVGAAAFLLTWILALALAPVDKRWLDVRSLSAILTVIGAAAGLSIALWAREHPYDVSTYLSDFRVDNRVGVEGNTAKTGYWIAMGVGMLILRHDLLRLMSTGTPTVRAFLVLLGAVLLQALYMIAATLVFIEYNLASVASLAIRLLLTAMEVAFVVIALRGGMRPLTALVLVLSVIDRARLLTP